MSGNNTDVKLQAVANIMKTAKLGYTPVVVCHNNKCFVVTLITRHSYRSTGNVKIFFFYSCFFKINGLYWLHILTTQGV